MTPQQEAAALRNFASAYDRYGVRARAQATVRVWKKGPELQAHSRFAIRNAFGVPAGRDPAPSPLTTLLSHHTKRRECLQRSD